MYTYLGSVPLKSGEQMDLGVIRCPDPSWGAQIKPLLGHKDRPAKEFFDAAFERPLDSLETRFYVGTIGGIAVTTVMIVGARGPAGGVGILGHVYTRPEHRQKGAYSQLMAAQMEDIRRAGYGALTLGTGFETPPYWIYHRFGFRSIDGVSGKMKWLANDEVEAQHFRPGAAIVRPMRWDDWPQLNLLAYQPAEPATVCGQAAAGEASAGGGREEHHSRTSEELPRSWVFRVKEQGGAVEGMFQAMRRNMARGVPITALTLASAHGAAVGWAILQPDELSFADGWLLDLYIYPAFRDEAPHLLEALPWPPRERVVAYSSAPDGYRAAALRAYGFKVVAELPGWLRRGHERCSLRVFARE